jgi:predicted patatin/cPLA2 family phospholipase
MLVNILSMFFMFVFNTANADKASKCNILSFSGGGSYGVVEIGMLEDLLEKNIVPQSYDIMTGISAGGLNAGFFSYYDNITDAVNDIKPVYFNMKTSDIYNINLFDIIGEWSLANTSPLRNLLMNTIQNKAQKNNTPLTLIGSSNVNTRMLDVFNFKDLIDINDRLDVLMATSAIPVLFPPQKINGSVYVDGGAISNEMITQAILAKDCSYYTIVFLSAFQKTSTVATINNVLSYSISLIEMILSTFDYQMTQFGGGNCNSPMGKILACYPTSPELASYSILDFNNGPTLFSLGKSSYTCTTINLCI